ncbi:hypothetical protein NW801_22040 [Brevibacillus laterosporus]|uniref:Uncharacterized protein n=1 Tax=Brevibacillus halotolerans TaxID=1507437 RepID=A0ABT4I2X9_9BACL|nr:MULTISPECIES: hypothetical protein [Brevibacillus]MCR8987674.1 hypothetical protein [Brevibacillus laterosporus]MCZ0833413.1 hypothetical protein [Brevibacillus halotolerans]
MQIHITLDSSFITGTNDQGRAIKIPSYVLPKTMLSRTREDYVVMTWPDGNPDRAQTFLVGQAAIFGGDADKRSESWFEIDEVKVLVGTVCSLLAIDNEPITILFHLPNFLQHKKSELNSIFTNFKANYNVKGKLCIVHITNIFFQEEPDLQEEIPNLRQEFYEINGPLTVKTDLPTVSNEENFRTTNKNTESKRYIFRQSIRLSHLTPEAERELKNQKNKSKYIETAVNFYASHQRKLEELQSIIQTMNIRR